MWPPHHSHSRQEAGLRRTSALMGTGRIGRRVLLGGRGHGCSEGTCDWAGWPRAEQKGSGIPGPCVSPKVDGLLWLAGWPSLQLGWQVLSGQRGTPPQGAQGSRWSPSGARKAGGADPDSSRSRWASVTLREAPFPQPTPHLLLSRAPPPRHLVDKYFPRERTPGVPGERVSPEDFGLESEIMGLGAAAFYRSNKLDTIQLVIHWQVSWGPALLAWLEEETEIKVNCIQGAGHPDGWGKSPVRTQR